MAHADHILKFYKNNRCDICNILIANDTESRCNVCKALMDKLSPEQRTLLDIIIQRVSTLEFKRCNCEMRY